jgi:hypothetical protein
MGTCDGSADEVDVCAEQVRGIETNVHYSIHLNLRRYCSTSSWKSHFLYLNLGTVKEKKFCRIKHVKANY